jgi:hypothetical protein
MSHLDPPRESCPPQDMGGDAAKYQYPPPPENEQTRAYHYPAASNSSFIPPSISYDSQFRQPGGYPQVSRVNYRDSYTDAQQLSSDYDRDQLGSSHGFQHMSSTRSTPRQRATVACRYCRRRKVSRYSFLTVIYISKVDFELYFQGIRRRILNSVRSYPGKKVDFVMPALPGKSLCSKQPHHCHLNRS